jgi:replicative DNA helicase
MSIEEEAVPHVEEAEESVLGAAMVSSGALEWVLANLGEDDFYRPAHRTIYRAVAQLAADGQQVNERVLMTALQVSGALPDVGGGPFIHTLAASADVPGAVGMHGRAVLDASIRRRAIDVAVQLRVLAKETSLPVDTVIGMAVDRLLPLTAEGPRADFDGAGLLKAVREHAAAEQAGSVVDWGLRDLDRYTRGLVAGRLVLVAARPAVGKTSLAIQTARRAAERDRVVFYSYEMSAAEVGEHILADLARVSMDEARALVDADDLGAARAVLEDLDVSVRTHGPDLQALCAEVQAEHAKRPLGLLVVDYLQLIPRPRKSKADTREQEVAEVSRAMKRLAAQLHIPVLACAQLNRGAVGRTPTLADLRESGQLEADADQVILLHREDDRSGVVEAHVGKNRMGPIGLVQLAWRPKTATFADYINL